MWPWKPKPLKIQTEYGEFTRATPKAEWIGTIESHGFKATIHATDVDGKPNPDLLSYISRIRRDWPTLKTQVQQAIPALSERHSELHIYDDIGANDFSLEFVNPSDENDEVCADFKRGQITGTFVTLDDEEE